MPRTFHRLDLGLDYNRPRLFIRDLNKESCDWPQMGLLLQCATDVLAVSVPLPLCYGQPLYVGENLLHFSGPFVVLL